MTSVSSFSSLRKWMRDFVHARDWHQFHTPRNVALALTGECGELSEIFQWKGITTPADIIKYPIEELTHIGEEISDVFIYTLRLSDLSGIDIAKAAAHILSGASTEVNYKTTHLHGPWTDMEFEELMSLAMRAGGNDPRGTILQINASTGIICGILATYTEEQGSVINIPALSDQHVTVIGEEMGRIAVGLASLSVFCGLNLCECINDKLTKNSLKYPAHLVKGSSAKYSTYNQTQWPFSMLGSLYARMKRVAMEAPFSLPSRRVVSMTGAFLLFVSVALDMYAIVQLGGYPQGAVVSTSLPLKLTNGSN